MSTYKSANLFDQIAVDLSTGALVYPSPKGFELDMERVSSSAERFLPHCSGDLALAIRHAVHQQILAFNGAVAIRASDALRAMVG